MGRVIKGCYLLCFSKPFQHARHYLGWSSDIEQRVKAHRAGSGARLVEVITKAGYTVKLVRTWPGYERTDERKLKNYHSPKLCPLCRQVQKTRRLGMEDLTQKILNRGNELFQKERVLDFLLEAYGLEYRDVALAVEFCREADVTLSLDVEYLIAEYASTGHFDICANALLAICAEASADSLMDNFYANSICSGFTCTPEEVSEKLLDTPPESRGQAWHWLNYKFGTGGPK